MFTKMQADSLVAQQECEAVAHREQAVEMSKQEERWLTFPQNIADKENL